MQVALLRLQQGAELVGEQAAVRLVGAQRLDGAPCRDVRAHQQPQPGGAVRAQPYDLRGVAHGEGGVAALDPRRREDAQGTHPQSIRQSRSASTESAAHREERRGGDAGRDPGPHDGVVRRGVLGAVDAVDRGLDSTHAQG